MTYIAQDEASGTGHPQFDKTVTDYMQVLASYAGMDVQYVPGSVQAFDTPGVPLRIGAVRAVEPAGVRTDRLANWK